MKKLIAFFILFSIVFSGTEVFAFSGEENAVLDLTTKSGFPRKNFRKVFWENFLLFRKILLPRKKNTALMQFFFARLRRLNPDGGDIASAQTIFSAGAEKIFPQKMNASILLHQK